MRLSGDVAASITQLNKNYDDLVRIQGEAATANSKEDTKRCGARFILLSGFTYPEVSHHVARLKEEALKVYIECTKADLTLNHHVVRSKWPGCVHFGSALATCVQV